MNPEVYAASAIFKEPSHSRRYLDYAKLVRYPYLTSKVDAMTRRQRGRSRYTLEQNNRREQITKGQVTQQDTPL